MKTTKKPATKTRKTKLDGFTTKEAKEVAKKGLTTLNQIYKTTAKKISDSYKKLNRDDRDFVFDFLKNESKKNVYTKPEKQMILNVRRLIGKNYTTIINNK